MATTLQILDDILAQVQRHLPTLAVELFPDRPAEYRLNHPVGAALLSYVRSRFGSRFGPVQEVGLMVQERTLLLSFTVLARQLHSRTGAIEFLDQLRTAVLGYAPLDCQGIRLVEERFLSEEAGIWSYAVDVTTTTLAVEDAQQASGPTPNEITLTADDGDITFDYEDDT